MLLFALVSMSEPPCPAGSLEESLLLEMGQGSQEALAGLYQATSAAVYGFALSIVKNVQDAEDIMQDVYLQAYAAAATYRPQGKPMAWVLTITRHLALMRLRERKRHTATAPADWGLASLDSQQVTDEDRIVLSAAIDSLGDEERQIVTLHALTGMKHREIAGLLDLPLATVLSKYRRALIKLKKYLTKEDAQ